RAAPGARDPGGLLAGRRLHVVRRRPVDPAAGHWVRERRSLALERLAVDRPRGAVPCAAAVEREALREPAAGAQHARLEAFRRRGPAVVVPRAPPGTFQDAALAEQGARRGTFQDVALAEQGARCGSFRHGAPAEISAV